MKVSRLIAALACLLLACAAAQAQGIIIPNPCQHCPRPAPIPPDFPMPSALKVKSIHITTKITEQGGDDQS